MNTLLDAIKQNAGKVAPAQAPVSGAQVGDILQTKATGKAAMDTGAPAASSIQEQQAQQTTSTQVKAVQQQGQAAAAELGAAEASQSASAELADKALDEQGENARSRLLQMTADTIKEYQMGTRTLDQQRDKAKLEQVGFGLRLTNEAYVSNLHREAQKSRLNSDAQFQEELTRSIFADEEELFREDLNFRAMMKADDREFNKQLAEMNISEALRVAAATAQAANATAQWTAAGNLASAGIEGYSDIKKSQATNAGGTK